MHLVPCDTMAQHKRDRIVDISSSTCCSARLIEDANRVGVRVNNVLGNASWRSVREELGHLGLDEIVVHVGKRARGACNGHRPVIDHWGDAVICEGRIDRVLHSAGSSCQ